MIRFKDIVPYFIALSLLGWVAWIILSEKEAILLLNRLTVGNIGVSILIAAILYFINGEQIRFLVKRSSGIVMKRSDSLILPASMNLWSYIFPVRGGLLFSMFYIKTKYNVKLSQGFSIGLFTFILSTSIAGGFGLYLGITNNQIISYFSLISLLLLLSPVFTFLSSGLLKKLLSIELGFFNTIMKIVHKTLSEFNEHIKDVRSTAFIVGSIFLSISVYIFWVYWAVNSFGMNLKMTSVILLAIVLRLSVIARFIPGNLGVQELLSGAAFQIVGENPMNGILVALFIRLCALSLGIAFGIYSFIANIEEFKSFSFTELWVKFKNY
ncbi:MAG: lysylphosphatidylglycerol synthase domain-containing protein [Vicingaceae bacterium]